MTEPRRIEVMSAAAAVGVSAEKTKTKPAPKTVRLLVPLTESTDDAYPEFSYVELLCKNAETSQGPSVDPKDPFAAQDQAEHDKLVAIARSFDSKYGLQPGKRNHTSVLEDFIDLGEGYEEDSFVDNSEAYDELVPSTMRTKYGGFYINSGELDFVPVDDHSTDGQMLKKKVKKRKVIESDGEEMGGIDKKKKMLKMKENGSDGSLKKKRKKLNVEDGKRCKGPPGRVLKSDKCKTVADFLNEASHTSNIKASDASPNLPNLPVSPTTKTFAPGLEKSIVSSPTLVSRSVSVSTDQRDHVPESLVTAEPKVETVAAVKNEQNISTIESSIDAVILQSREEATLEKNETTSEMTVQSLPNSIPSELLRNIERMKELALAGKVTSDESPSGHRFTNEALQLLSEIHESLSRLQQHDRLAVLSHLGCYFPSGKEGLIKRMKKLDLTLHGDQLKQPIARLKEAIQAVMPSLIEKHRVEVTAKEKLRMDQLQEQKERKEPKDGVAQSDSDDDEENRDTAEKQRRIVAPRKKFEWNDDIRKLLCKVVDIKMEHFEMSKIRSQAPEDYLKSFLEAEIKPLWPPGWIQTRMLFKQSRSSHNRWTCNTQKMKKSALVFPKTSTPVVTTALDVGELGSGNHAATLSFNTPVAVPGTKLKLLLEEALSGNLNKFQEPPTQAATPTSGTPVSNGLREESPGEVLYTSISSKLTNRHEREMNRNNGWDLMVENDASLQKLRKGLLSKSPVVAQETENAAKHSVPSKPLNVDRCDTTIEAADQKVLISSSLGSNAPVMVPKARNEPNATLPVDFDVERPPTNSVQKSMTPSGIGNPFVAHGYLDEGMNFSSRKTSPGRGEGLPADPIHSNLHDRLCKVDDKQDPVTHRPSNIANVDQILRLISGKSSDATSVGLGLIAQDSATRFTELRSLQRQSSSDANSQVQQMPGGCTSLAADPLDLQSHPLGHRASDVSPKRMQQEASTGPSLGQTASGLIQPKAINQGLYKVVPLVQQKPAVSSPAISKWSLKGSSTPTWVVSTTVDEKSKYAIDVGKTMSGSRLTSGNVVSTQSSSGQPLPVPKELPLRLMTSRAAVSTDKSSVARPSSSRSSTTSEEVAKVALRFSQARHNSPNEEAMMALMNEDLLRLLPPESLQSFLELCHSSQGLTKTKTAEARPFDIGSSSELTSRGLDHSRLIHGITTATQSWRPSDKSRDISHAHGTNAATAGYRVGQMPNTGLGERTAEYSQHQSVKTSIPSSSHDHIQMTDAVKFSGSPLPQSVGSMISCQPQKTVAFCSGSGELLTVPSSQTQNSAMHNVRFKGDSLSPQHHCQ